MSIRSNALPLRGDISRELQDLLRRNGMQAHIQFVGDRIQLVVQGHDSPLMRYDINKYQFQALQDGGTNSSNKKAYQTFNSIVKNDFDLPKAYVYARNANGRVAMGLHGYRIGAGEYGRPMGVGYGRWGAYPQFAYGPGYLGWTPNRQPGFHLRRIDGTLYAPGGPMVADRVDGRVKPGELQSGGYGYYFKGDRVQSVNVAKIDSLQDVQQLQAVFQPVESLPRPTKEAIPYKEHITSDVYFTKDKWLEVLASHGLVVDADKKTLVVQSLSAPVDQHYDLTDEQLKVLTSNSLKEYSVVKRLQVINDVIGDDFDDKVTFERINSKEQLSIKLKPEVESKLQQESVIQMQKLQQPLAPGYERFVVVPPTQDPEKGYVNGQALNQLNENKGWYREGKHGREVEVSGVWVEKVQNQAKEDAADARQDAESKQRDGSKVDDTKYKITAVINGEAISREITERQYQKFMAVDDYHRLKMVSKLYPEVDMKTQPGKGFNFGAFLLAGLQVASEATYLGADIAHNVEHIKHPHGPAPEIYQESHGRASILFNPMTDSPEDIAARAYDRGLHDANHSGVGMGR